jgi:phosphoesterase RecJ-like protein
MAIVNKKLVPQNIIKTIRKAEKIIIASHEDPDPDALGSIFGLYFILRRAFPKKRFWLYNATPQKPRKILSEFYRLKRKLPRERFDLLIGLDAGSFDRLVCDKYVKKFSPKIIFIDHHPRNKPKGDIIWIRPAEEATANLIYQLAKAGRWQIDRKAATALLLGIFGDTRGFSLVKNPDLFLVVRELVRLGSPLEKIYRHTFGWESRAEMELFGLALQRARFVREKRLLWSYLTKAEIKAAKTRAGGFSWISNSLRDYIEAEAALFLRELPDGWEGSLRTVSSHPTDLGKAAGMFGGGGHFHAAGFKTKLPKDVILRKILQALPLRR